MFGEVQPAPGSRRGAESSKNSSLVAYQRLGYSCMLCLHFLLASHQVGVPQREECTTQHTPHTPLSPYPTQIVDTELTSVNGSRSSITSTVDVSTFTCIEYTSSWRGQCRSSLVAPLLSQASAVEVQAWQQRGAIQCFESGKICWPCNYTRTMLGCAMLEQLKDTC